MALRPFGELGAFDPAAITAMSEALEVAFKKLGDVDQPEVVREIIAGRIIAVAKLGERDPARLLEAALRARDCPVPRFSPLVALDEPIGND